MPKNGFPKNNYKGIFIALEGLDGSGLSTQSRLVVDLLRLQGFKAFHTKEPSNNIVGGLIRGVLSGVTTFPSNGLQLLFAADRAHHLIREVIPLLSEGAIVISDRYYWTSVAYGGVNLSKDWLLSVNGNFLMPDLTIFLDLHPDISLKRIKKDRFELEIFEEKTELLKIRQNYAWLFKKFPKQFAVIDAGSDREEIAKEIAVKIMGIPKLAELKKVRLS